MAKPKQTKTAYSDEDLKQIMLQSLFADSNFRITFKDDLESCMRCWDILQNDKDFLAKYKEVINMKISGMEEEVMKAHKKLARNLTPLQKNVVLHIMKGKNHQQAYYAAGGKNQNKYQANQTVSRMLRQHI